MRQCVSEHGCGYVSRSGDDSPLLRKNGHEIINREQLELLMTAAKSRSTHEDRHRFGNPDRAVIPIHAKAS
jgi:hypothetical protein